ncbi:protein EPIDERMAL PATTERNING FACTOR 1 isoform X2 [Nicotiana tomentosiformis]|uniref:Epidermal patterning factor-like protein n=1 Tax=Nicotiana tabacum TaxID=4097 RepID=A0A1S3YY24_TOBAC|nr:protein EPIDERMAL PATTERNING FACTOR 1 isoform X2 [Nicotiana tomentosiformis]XP_016456747.1 PREDICTED: protein EPIDERMAL PATTERNING FACTOR 1-like isoform X2 [Nicotiana tabacum]
MKSCVFTATVLILLIVFLPVFINARHIRNLHSQQNNHPMNPVISRKKAMARTEMSWELRKGSTMHKRGAETLQIAGSRLPDCSHACGSCRPCRLVMVSFVCSSLEEAETCPMAYKCMCHNKSYPVP